jgi:hypothetical protein
MWQTVVMACALWVVGSLVIHVGIWLTDKTVMLPVGAVLIGLGSLIQFLSFLVFFK